MVDVAECHSSLVFPLYCRDGGSSVYLVKEAIDDQIHRSAEGH